MFVDSESLAVPLALIVAVSLGVAAQGLINQMMEGDQGLGAYLRDGSGYQKSGFKQKEQEASTDPLPWLKLPQLDFVEVAGQQNKQDDMIIGELERRLKTEMRDLLDQGRLEEANQRKLELEQLMLDNDIDYNID